MSNIQNETQTDNSNRVIAGQTADGAKPVEQSGTIEGATRDSGSPPPGPVAPVLKHTPSDRVAAIDRVPTSVQIFSPILRSVGSHWCVFRENGDVLAIVVPAGDTDSRRFAQLFASSELLLDALKGLLPHAFQPVYHGGTTTPIAPWAARRQAHKAIERAEGKVQS